MAYGGIGRHNATLNASGHRENTTNVLVEIMIRKFVMDSLN